MQKIMLELVNDEADEDDWNARAQLVGIVTDAAVEGDQWALDQVAESVIANTAAFKSGASAGHAVTTLAKSESCRTCVPICVRAFVSCSCFNSSS